MPRCFTLLWIHPWRIWRDWWQCFPWGEFWSTSNVLRALELSSWESKLAPIYCDLRWHIKLTQFSVDVLQSHCMTLLNVRYQIMLSLNGQSLKALKLVLSTLIVTTAIRITAMVGLCVHFQTTSSILFKTCSNLMEGCQWQFQPLL